MSETPVPTPPTKYCPRCKAQQEITLRRHPNPTGGTTGFCKTCELMLTTGDQTRSGPISDRKDF
jgi:predicted SprT family Zn-dependent metalloprotease